MGIWIDANTELTFTSPRNVFYENTTPRYSMVKTLFNQDQGNVKRFKTINYEGTQAQVVPKIPFGMTQIGNFHQLHDSFSGVSFSVNRIIEDNYYKEGWFIDNIQTDIQKGSIRSFVEKENKWYDYIKGDAAGDGDNLDTGDFSLQGLGTATNII